MPLVIIQRLEWVDSSVCFQRHLRTDGYVFMYVFTPLPPFLPVQDSKKKLQSESQPPPQTPSIPSGYLPPRRHPSSRWTRNIPFSRSDLLPSSISSPSPLQPHRLEAVRLWLRAHPQSLTPTSRARSSPPASRCPIYVLFFS